MNQTPRFQISRRTLLGGTIAVGGLVLTGCSDTATTPEGNSGGTLTIGMPTDVVLSTILRFQANNQPLRRNVFEYVVDRNPDGTYEPYLAESWEFSEDNLQLVIELRDDVTFHTGREFGPDDVIASIEAALVPEAGAQSGKLLARASGMEKTGDYQLTVTFDEPFANFLDGLAMLPIVDSETYPTVTEGEQVIGTGPFKWGTWKAGSSLELVRNEDYWQDDRPYLDKLIFNVIADPQALLAAMKSGDTDLAMRMIARDGATLANDSRFEVGTTAAYEVYLGINTKVKPLDDVRVRQAIAYALDRTRISDQVYSSYGTPSSVPWIEGTPGVTDEQRDFYDTDLDKAKALIEEAGAAGTEIAVSSLSAEPTTGAVSEIVQFNLEEIGLKPKVVTYEAAQFAEVNQGAAFEGVWITDVALTAMGQVTALLTANPLTVGANTSNFTEKGYEDAVNALVEVSASGEDTTTASADLTDYMLEQAFHNSIAQVQTLVAHSAKVTGVTSDLTLALDFTDAQVSS